MEEQQNITESKPKRPQLLTILCILTFIGSGFGVFVFFIVAVNYEGTMEIMRTVYANMPEARFLLDAPRDFFLISFIISASSVMGAVLMWNLRKTGFHIYTSAQLINLILPFIYFGGETNPFLNILLTALFVYLYARNLQFMH
ncbi:MAG: hypothetical protein KAT76_08160 [Bacteroidales bacterium]|nr:hypothetical protein [Bacteroidales bacterium]